MAPREDETESSRGPVNHKTGETVAQEAADQMTVAKDVDADCLFTDEPGDDHVIRNLNKIGRMKLMRPEFIEEVKKDHRTHLALCNKHYEELFKELEEERIAAAAAAAAQSSTQDTNK